MKFAPGDVVKISKDRPHPWSGLAGVVVQQVGYGVDVKVATQDAPITIDESYLERKTGGLQIIQEPIAGGGSGSIARLDLVDHRGRGIVLMLRANHAGRWLALEAQMPELTMRPEFTLQEDALRDLHALLGRLLAPKV